VIWGESFKTLLEKFSDWIKLPSDLPVSMMPLLRHVCEWLQAENEIASLSRKLSLLEDDYEKSQASLKTANDRIHELTISSDESERFATSF